jgi:hypothetical protein
MVPAEKPEINKVVKKNIAKNLIFNFIFLEKKNNKM